MRLWAIRPPEQEEYEAFANDRIGSRPQLKLVFRQEDSDILAFLNAYLSLIESDDPATAFTLHIPPNRVRIITCLSQLICQHPAAKISESTQQSVLP